jgi:hypothetical protein
MNHATPALVWRDLATGRDRLIVIAGWLLGGGRRFRYSSPSPACLRSVGHGATALAQSRMIGFLALLLFGRTGHKLPWLPDGARD